MAFGTATATLWDSIKRTMSTPSVTAHATHAVDANTHHRISTLFTQYAHCLDDDRTDDWPGFFTADGLYQITTRENEAAGYPIGLMRCEGRGMMEDRMLALKIANIYEPQHACHLLGPAEIHPHTDGSYHARSNFSVFRTMQSGDASLFATGKYLDHVVNENGQLRFQSRRVIIDSRCIDVLLVLPL